MNVFEKKYNTMWGFYLLQSYKKGQMEGFGLDMAEMINFVQFLNFEKKKKAKLINYGKNTQRVI